MALAQNIGAQVELEELLELLESNRHLPPDQQLELLEKRMREDLEAAKGGWL